MHLFCDYATSVAWVLWSIDRSGQMRQDIHSMFALQAYIIDGNKVSDSGCKDLFVIFVCVCSGL